MTMKFKTTRICAGEYVVCIPAIDSIGPGRVRVTKVHYPKDGAYWIASANWDRYLYSDPVTTKRRAVEIAHTMLMARLGDS